MNRKLISLVLMFMVSFFAINVFAAEPIAKEDTAPTPPEGPLPLTKIPPINTKGQPLKIALDSPDNPFFNRY